MLDDAVIQNILEAALFAAGKPMTVAQLSVLFLESERPTASELKKNLEEIIERYQERPVKLMCLAEGYAFRVASEWAEWVARLWEEKPQRYSRAFLETLAIIAYRQPVTRAEIEAIRGVAVNPQILKTLQEREWIRVVGHKEVPGRPELLATTSHFLSYFNLSRLQDLPPLTEVKDLDEAALRLESQLAEVEGATEVVIVKPETSADPIENVINE